MLLTFLALGFFLSLGNFIPLALRARRYSPNRGSSHGLENESPFIWGSFCTPWGEFLYPMNLVLQAFLILTCHLGEFLYPVEPYIYYL